MKEVELRVAVLRRDVLDTQAEELAQALDTVCGAAEQADPVAREILGAVMPTLTDVTLVERFDALRAIASAEALLPLGRLLRRPRSSPEVRERSSTDERLLATSRSGRVLTLGERRALARRPSRAALDALMRDPHPLVIRNLLGNPRVTEDDVIRMAARRPVATEVSVEIARHPRWSQRSRVRMALVQNPGSPPEIAVPLVRLLIRPELLQVAAAPDVPRQVRAAAAELLERRPPLAGKGKTASLPQ
ncbi:hypothetical protein [Chondromyces apiculatus]|uniref:Leucine rich repeat variant n=1 Tax=Chondromyces apiculatus DSM 436 TaxID=1192034 RepID=A0A017T8K5_9BACT|nr:hypothetical protein [Chondromyces apiculatus]EYF05544.1 Hypothetical protein CAP_3092 [Chondromyces apiculatus DSM 436]